MLDLFAGLGGASQAMRARGWRVTTVELVPAFRPDVVGDVARLPIRGHFDLVWASPPCTEFARESMPWSRTGSAPDMALVEATLSVVKELRPTWWVMENVRGAVPWIGSPALTCGPFFLWGCFPPFECHVEPFKERLSSTQRAERAKVPYALSDALACAIEGTLPLFAESWA